MNALEIAQRYFEVSNASDFVEIGKLLSDTSTYSSQNTGLYLGREAIVEMQHKFHASFTSLHWDIKEFYEEKPGIVCIDFEFTGIQNGKVLFFQDSNI